MAATGLDTNPGTAAAPWLTLRQAAQTLQPGDTCTVHAGIYREQLDPVRGGSSDAARIVYRAATGDQVSIRGSEQVKTWATDGAVWKVVLPNTTFGTFNPYSEKIKGSYLTYGSEYHLGEVYLDGAPYSEVLTQDEVSKTPGTWHAEVDCHEHDDLGQFRRARSERRARRDQRAQVCRVAEKLRLKFITIDGFDIRQGATNWARPTRRRMAW
ncbi:MAG: hypothetical protein WDO74_30825 [Pseudomonadota bacterium]